MPRDTTSSSVACLFPELAATENCWRRREEEKEERWQNGGKQPYGILVFFSCFQTANYRGQEEKKKEFCPNPSLIENKLVRSKLQAESQKSSDEIKVEVEEKRRETFREMNIWGDWCSCVGEEGAIQCGRASKSILISSPIYAWSSGSDGRERRRRRSCRPERSKPAKCEDQKRNHYCSLTVESYMRHYSCTQK